ncbi:MAG: extracellular solute-binding protein [Desulfobacterales bacterium]|nr:MAG: extracellular solute-binding protein [Desulfobacterales bacterium]
MKFRFATIAALALVLTFGTVGSGLHAAESISAYMGFSREVNEALADRIQKELGIEVKNITLSWGEIWARLVSEAPRFNADMVLSFGAAQAIDGTKKGYYIPYKSPNWEDIDAAFKSPDGSYYALGTFSFLLIGNKVKLAEKGYGMPMSWKELLDPKWKGQIVAPSPRTSGTAFMINYSFLQLYGEKEGWKFLEALDKNMAQYTKSGNAPTDLVGRGEFLLGITADENVLKRINDGYPIQWVIPAEGIGYEGNYCTILKGTEKLDLAKKIMDYLGTKDASAFLASMGYIPPRPGIPSALYGAAKPTFIKLDHDWAVQNRSKIIKTWKSKFMMKETTKAREVGDQKEAEEAKKKQ